jgi:streptomycin 6-kinase
VDARVGTLAPLAHEIAAEWGLELGERFASRHSYIAAVGREAILKVVRPEIAEYEHEPDALRIWDGDHAVRLLRHDRPRRALLLERARPGHDLSGVREDEAMLAATEVGQALWRRVDAAHPFADVISLSHAWLSEVEGQDPELVGRARAVLAGLGELRTPRLVHGDLHHHNILRRGTGWAAIDPQPAIGEPEYDVATFLWNPVGTMPTAERTARWLSAFAAAGLDPARMRAWAIVRGTVLSISGRPGRPRHAPQLRVALSLLDESQ